MSEITQDEWQEVLKWCGFSRVDYVDTEPIRYGEYGNIQCLSEYPTLDLNNLFKYPVYGKLPLVYRNWKCLLHDWVDNLTGDIEKDTDALFKICQEVRSESSDRPIRQSSI